MSAPIEREIVAALVAVLDPGEAAYAVVVDVLGGGYVQAAEESDGVLRVEVGDPAHGGLAGLRRDQLRRLEELGFRRGDPNFEQIVAAGHETAAVAADRMAMTLADVFGARGREALAIELLDAGHGSGAGSGDLQPAPGEHDGLWFACLADAPGIDSISTDRVASLEWPEGRNARPHIRATALYEPEPEDSLWWPLRGVPGGTTSESPAEQWFRGSDPAAAIRDRIDRLLASLHLPASTRDFHRLLEGGIRELSGSAARREGVWRDEWVERLAVLDTTLVLAYPRILDADDPREGEGVRTLVRIRHGQQRLEEAVDLARRASAVGIPGTDVAALEMAARGGAPEAGREPPRGPALIVFERPDGKLRWALARDPADYVARLALGEYASRNLPVDSQFRLAIPLDDPHPAVGALKDELNWDQELGARVMEARERGSGERPGSDDPRDRAVAVLAAGRVDDAASLWDLAREVAEARRLRKAPQKRKATTSFKARDGRVSTALVAALAHPYRAAAHAGSFAWIFPQGGADAIWFRDDGSQGTVTMPPVGPMFRPFFVRPSEDGERCAAFSFDVAAIVGRDCSSALLDVGLQVHAVTSCRRGVFAVRDDGSIAGWDWGGEPLMQSDPLGTVADLAVAGELVVYRTRDGRVGAVDLATGQEGRLGFPAPATAYAVASHQSGVLVLSGSTFTRIASGETTDLRDWFHLAVHDSAGKLVGWASRERLAVLAADGSVTKLVPHRRTVSGAWQANAAHGENLVVTFGKETAAKKHGIDVVDLRTGQLTAELDAASRVEVVCAWHVGSDVFRVIAGPGLHELRLT